MLPTQSSSKRRNPTSLLFFAVLLAVARPVAGFSMKHADNSYKPPVQRSVRKLLQQRRRTSTTNPSASQPDNKRSAFAGTLSMPAPTSSSFEERMRNLVQQPQKPVPAPPRPTNVQVVDNLLQYKQVVGDETEQFVVVRFYAGYCKVGLVLS